MEQQETMTATEPANPSSLPTRIMNVFSSPTELWSEVAAMPVQKSSWVVPYVCSLLLVVLFTFALFNNESLRNQIFDMQIAAMQKAVEEGKMSEAQLEQVEEQMRGSGLGMFMLFGSVPQLVVLSIMFFGMALFLWLAAKFVLKATAGYAKLLEVTGLVSFIGILGAVITLLMMYAFDSLYASPGLALAVLESYDPQDKLHTFLYAINVFTVWETSVVGLALSKISGKSTGVGMGAAFGLWLAWTILSVLLGLRFR